MTGKKFNNFVLDLISNEDFNSNTISNPIQTEAQVSRAQTQEVKQKDLITPVSRPTTIEGTEEILPKVQAKPIPKYEETTGEISEENLNKYYALVESSPITLSKKGVPTKYLEGTFYNKDNAMIKAIVNPIYADEMSKCNLGSQFILELKKIGEHLFIEDCKYIFKQLKTEVA